MEQGRQEDGTAKQRTGRGRKRRNNRNKRRNASDVHEGEIDCDSSHYVYLIIGSKDSTDLDTLYVFNSLPPTQLCYKFCDFVGESDRVALKAETAKDEEKEKERTEATTKSEDSESALSYLQRQRRLKVENKNIIVLNDEGIVCDSFKGITDAIHNCVYYTYALHEQDHPSPLAHRLVHRNVPMRLVKATRDLMGIISKTRYRQHSKAALKSKNGFVARRECLMRVDFREVKDELNASQLKTVAFHFSQLIGLMRGREYFTKADLAAAFPDLAPFLRRADDAASHLEVLNKYRDTFVEMIGEGLHVHARGPLLLFAADPEQCRDRWNMLTYGSRGAIVDCVREQCVAYPLDHFFALGKGGQDVSPSWPTDEELLERENLSGLVVTTTTTTTSTPTLAADEEHRRRLEFYTAFIDPTTHRPDIASERSFDVPQPVRKEWSEIVERSQRLRHDEETTSQLQAAMKLYTFIFAWRPVVEDDDRGTGRLVLFGLRHHHTWEMQPLAIVRRVADKVGLN